MKGSRFKRLPIPLHILTDVVYQLRIQLEIRKPALCLSTYRKYITMIHNMQEWLTSQNRSNLAVGALTNMDAKMFMHYLQSKKRYSHSSINGHLTGLRSFYDEIVIQGMSSSNPFVGLKLLPKNYTASLYYQPGQVQLLKKIIHEKDPQLWQFVKFIFYCFIRPGELRQLKLSDIFFSENKISRLNKRNQPKLFATWTQNFYLKVRSYYNENRYNDLPLWLQFYNQKRIATSQ